MSNNFILQWKKIYLQEEDFPSLSLSQILQHTSYFLLDKQHFKLLPAAVTTPLHLFFENQSQQRHNGVLEDQQSKDQ